MNKVLDEIKDRMKHLEEREYREKSIFGHVDATKPYFHAKQEAFANESCFLRKLIETVLGQKTLCENTKNPQRPYEEYSYRDLVDYLECAEDFKENDKMFVVHRLLKELIMRVANIEAGTIGKIETNSNEKVA